VIKLFVDGGKYENRVLLVQGQSVEKFYSFLKNSIPEFVLPDLADTISVKCKSSDPLLILDEGKSPINGTEIQRDDRVLVTFNVNHWVIRKQKTSGFRFQLLSIRHLPLAENEDDTEKTAVYTGPDF
jgi:hypothetical protein